MNAPPRTRVDATVRMLEQDGQRVSEVAAGAERRVLTVPEGQPVGFLGVGVWMERADPFNDAVEHLGPAGASQGVNQNLHERERHLTVDVVAVLDHILCERDRLVGLGPGETVPEQSPEAVVIGLGRLGLPLVGEDRIRAERSSARWRRR